MFHNPETNEWETNFYFNEWKDCHYLNATQKKSLEMWLRMLICSSSEQTEAAAGFRLLGGASCECPSSPGFEVLLTCL